jgi:hypothetical protein
MLIYPHGLLHVKRIIWVFTIVDVIISEMIQVYLFLQT